MLVCVNPAAPSSKPSTYSPFNSIKICSSDAGRHDSRAKREKGEKLKETQFVPLGRRRIGIVACKLSSEIHDSNTKAS
jgi:hypothetical protein